MTRHARKQVSVSHLQREKSVNKQFPEDLDFKFSNKRPQGKYKCYNDTRMKEEKEMKIILFGKVEV